MTKIFSKNAIALKAAQKIEGAQIVEIDGKFHVMNPEEFAAHNQAIEDAAVQFAGNDPDYNLAQTEGGTDELQQQYESEGTVTIVMDLGLNPTAHDRSKLVKKAEKFERTRYVIQQKTADGKRAFLPAAGIALVAWKFWAAQFDSVEAANQAIAGEEDLSVVPFRKAWLETFHPAEEASAA